MPDPAPLIHPEDLTFLQALAADVIEASRVRQGETVGASVANTTGNTLIRPGATAHYPAFWVRDFAMSVDCGLVPDYETEHALRLIASRQHGPCQRELRPGVAIPPWAIADHLLFDGTPVFFPGGYSGGDDQGGGPFGNRPPIDNTFELIHLAFRLWQKSSEAKELLLSPIQGVALIDRLLNAYLAAPVDHTGAVISDRQHRAVGMGFYDLVCLTGSLLFPTLLRVRAMRELVPMLIQSGRSEPAESILVQLPRMPETIATKFANDPSGWLRAATDIGRQPDCWGTLYAIFLKALPGDIEKQCIATIADGVRQQTFVSEAAVRHLPTPTVWEQSAIEPHTYQNGAYWHTATGWLIAALANSEPELARDLVTRYVNHLRRFDYRSGGSAPLECFNNANGYSQNPSYMTSVTVPLAMLQSLTAEPA